jgi:hypothetical protein
MFVTCGGDVEGDMFYGQYLQRAKEIDMCT